jgi:hypothetical protein
LQVRIAVEVIHCKNPKSMITEAVSVSSALDSTALTRSASAIDDARESAECVLLAVPGPSRPSIVCVKLLRKTVLQVRIAVEVIHCKNPKSMITEAVSLPSLVPPQLSTMPGNQQNASCWQYQGQVDRVLYETVSQTCVKLLRKTVLQVRIAVEVIHCKNPKSMIIRRSRADETLTASVIIDFGFLQCITSTAIRTCKTWPWYCQQDAFC